MKNVRKQIFVCILILVAILLSSCNWFGDKDGNGGDQAGSVTYQVLASASYEGDNVFEILSAMKTMTNIRAVFVPDSSEATEYEIVFGKTNRDISRIAYEKLEEIDSENPYHSRYLIYSNGKSVAIAYEEDDFSTKAAEQAVTDVFLEIYSKGKTHFEAGSGVISSGTVDFVAYQRELDEGERELSYTSIHHSVMKQTGDRILADDIVAAFREYYDLTTPNIVSWLANLYEPDIDAATRGEDDPVRGGFYFSNSGRDTDGFLPDLESTAQAMMIIHYSGLVDHIGGQNGMPDWFKEQIGNFAKSLQDPNGFFYHPQWGKEMTDRNQERRARDAGSALGLLSLAGMTPTYSIYETVGDGMLIDGTRVDSSGNVIPASTLLPSRLGGRSTAGLVSKVIATAQTYVSPELLTKEAFIKWLEGGCGYKIENGSYGWGSFVCSREREYSQRDKQLAAENADWRCSTVLIDFLNEHQNPENGTWEWGDESNERYYYNCVNGLLKIGGTYTAFGYEMPYALEACRTAINAISSDTTPIHICDVYNPWFAVSNILNNLSTCADNPLEGKNKVADVRRALLIDAPSSILKTLEKRAIFKKSDGSFSYFPSNSSQHSTGMPVALKEINEGDVNATIIAAIDIRDRMCSALGLPTVDILGAADYVEFITILEELQPVIKDEYTSVLVPITFDEYTVDTIPSDELVNTTGFGSGGNSVIIEDPRENAKGNVFKIEKIKGKADTLRFSTGDASISANCSVFEAEMCFESACAGYLVQLSLEYGYMVGMRFDNERCYFFDTSSQTGTRVDNDFERSVPIGEWFKLRIEYYPDDEENVRAKVYLNDELIAVSDNYYDFYGYKITNGTGTPEKRYAYGEILGMSGSEFVLLIDNVTVGKTRNTYKVSSVGNSLAVNVDAPAESQKIYDFEDLEADDEYPEDFAVISGSNTVEVIGDVDKALYINRTSGDSFKIDIPTTRTSTIPNSTTVSMDVEFLSYNVGASLHLGFRQRGSDFLEYAVTGYLLKIEEEAGKKYIVMYECVGDVAGTKVGGIKIPAEQAFNLKIEYYSDNKTTLIYIDNALLGLSSATGAGVNKYKVGELVMKSLSNTAYEVTLDNIIVENGLNEFEEATKPTVDRVTHTFDSEEGVEFSGEASATGGRAMIRSGGAVTIPLNKRSVAAGTVVLDTMISFTGTKNSIIFTDADGNPIITYTVKLSGGKVNIHETTERMIYDVPIASFDSGKTVRLFIEYYTARDVVQIFVDGKCLAVSSLQYNDAAENAEITSVKIVADSGTVIIDELVIEAYNKLYTEYDTSGDNTDDGKNTLGFESSTGGNLPSSVTYSLGSGGAVVRVDEVMKATERSKVVILSTTAGGADTLTIEASKRHGSYNCVALETDISIHYNGGVYLFFKAGSNDIYRINLNMTNGSLHVDDNPGFPPYGTMGNPDIKVDICEWVRLRFEFYNKEDGTIAVKIAVNGKFLTESNEPSWKGNAGSITLVNMTTNTAGVGDVMIDDIFFGSDNMTINTDDVYIPEGGESGGDEPEEDPEVVIPTEKDTETYEDGTHDIYIDGKGVGSVVSEGDNKYYSLDKSTKTEDYLYIPKSLYSPENADCTVFETRMRIVADPASPIAVNIIYGRWNGMQKFTLFTSAGSDAIAIGDWRDDVSSSLSVTDIGAKLNAWFTLRIENYLNEEGETVARVYVNGINIGESTNTGVLGAESANHHLNSLVIKANNNIIGSFDLDDTYFGADVMTVVEEKKPVEDFEDGVHGITIDGGSVRTPGTIVTDGDNSYYNKPTDTSDYLYIKKSAYEPEGADCIAFEVKMRINHTGSNSCSFKVFYGTWKGMEKFNVYNPTGDDLVIYDSRSGVSSSINAGSGAKIGEWFTLRIENYINENGETIARVYVNGNLIGESTNIGVLGSESENHNLDTVSLLLNNNIKGSVDIDDVYLGADKMIVVGEEKPVEDFEDEEVGANKLTNSPSISTSIDAGTATATVASDGENKYFEIDKTAKGTAAFYAGKMIGITDADCYVFEADISFDFTSTDIQNNVYFYIKTGSHVHRLWMYNQAEKPDEFFLLDYWYEVNSTTMSGHTGIGLKDDFHIRIEYLDGDDGNIIARVYIDGILFGETSSAISASYEDITRVDVWLTGNSVCTAGFDNVYSGFDKMIQEVGELENTDGSTEEAE